MYQPVKNLERLFTEIDRKARWNSKPERCLMCGNIETRGEGQICAVCNVLKRAAERVKRGEVEALVFYRPRKIGRKSGVMSISAA